MCYQQVMFVVMRQSHIKISNNVKPQIGLTLIRWKCQLLFTSKTYIAEQIGSEQAKTCIIPCARHTNDPVFEINATFLHSNLKKLSTMVVMHWSSLV